MENAIQIISTTNTPSVTLLRFAITICSVKLRLALNKILNNNAVEKKLQEIAMELNSVGLTVNVSNALKPRHLKEEEQVASRT
jgi:hypothetical protein